MIQGSRLGPLLFDIYSNDLNKLCSHDENILYADDACLVYKGNDIDVLLRQINQRLVTIQSWCNANKMSLNPMKSKYMIVTNRQKHHEVQLFLGNNQLEEVDTFKYLGLFIDSNLKFQTHIDYINAKLSRMCGVTFRLKNLLDLDSAKNIYYACIYSVVSYALAVYGGISMCTRRADGILKLQSRIVKNLTVKFYPNSNSLFREIGFMKFPDIYKLKVGVYMFRIMVLNQFPNLREQLEITYPQHDHFTRAQNEPRLPLPRVESIRMNFQYQFILMCGEIYQIM